MVTFQKFDPVWCQIGKKLGKIGISVANTDSMELIEYNFVPEPSSLPCLVFRDRSRHVSQSLLCVEGQTSKTQKTTTLTYTFLALVTFY